MVKFNTLKISMSDKSNNILKKIPKITKKIKGFLTDESWKITKKDALWLWTWALLLSWIDDAMWAIHNVTWTVPDWKGKGTNFVGVTADTNVQVQHASWIVNWHYSSTPWYSIISSEVKTGHWSHGSHWSHWSRR